MGGRPRAPFYIALLLVVGGLVVFALNRSDWIAPKGVREDQPVTTSQTNQAQPQQEQAAVEAADTGGVTTVKDYAFRPAERLPEVKGISAYKALENNTVRFALNVWAGWGPIIFANNGFKPSKVWKTPDGKEFKVELVLIDNPVAMRDAYAAGEVH